MRKLFGIILCLITPLLLLLITLQRRFLESGILNTKELPPFIGDETGTFYEHLFNVWHWDMMLFLLMVAALLSFAFGVLLFFNDLHRLVASCQSVKIFTKRRFGRQKN